MDQAEYIQTTALIVMYLLSFDVYKSIKEIREPRKRKVIGATIMTCFLANKFLLFFRVFYTGCYGAISFITFTIYLCRGLISYLYLAQTELVIALQFGAKSHKALLRFMKFLIVLSVFVNCGKSLLVYHNVKIQTGDGVQCVPIFGSAGWGPTDEIMFGIVDLVTVGILIRFFNETRRRISPNSLVAARRRLVNTIFLRLIVLSSISLVTTFGCIVFQVINPAETANLGTLDISIGMLTLGIVFIKPSRNQGGDGPTINTLRERAKSTNIPGSSVISVPVVKDT